MSFLLDDHPRPGVGEQIPLFSAPLGGNPTFQIGSLGGRHLLFCFPGADTATALPALNMLMQITAAVDSLHAFCLAIVPPQAVSVLQPRLPDTRLMADPDGGIARGYGFGPEGGWLLADPMLRVMARLPLSAGPDLLTMLQRLPRSGLAGDPALLPPAPVLQVPGVFEPEFCRHLVALYQRRGGKDSGFMRDQNGQTVGVIDYRFKRRSDMEIDAEDIRRAARQRIERRLVPVIARAMQFKVTRMERYIVVCYDGSHQGFFSAHRDNTTKATAHRKLAVTINLNTEDYTGGDLRFPEYGSRSYRAATGGAVVFSCSLLHEAMAVTSGQRFAFVPFLYDEEGARTREANIGFLGDGTSRYSASAAAAGQPA